MELHARYLKRYASFSFAILSVLKGDVIMGGGNAAYNLRKMAPRILIAFIGVQLSFFLSSLMIDIFNGLGSGVANLFYQIADANNVPIVDTTAIQGGQLRQVPLALGSGAAAGLLLSGGGIAG